MAKRTKKLNKKSLKLEALESRQLLAGVTGGGTEVGSDIHHPNGNVYDQVLMTGASVAVTADAGQVTRVSFLDMQGDIVQAEFSGAGTLTVSLDGATTDVAPDKYIQSGVKYVQGNATFTITGSDASTNLGVFSVGKGNAVNQALFDDTHNGGDSVATVQRVTIVADPSNPNGSIFGGIFAGNTVFTGDKGVVGITAASIQVQNTVRIGDIDATGTATPALVFGTNSQFGSVEIAGGDLAQTNGKSINNSGSYGYQITAIDGQDSAGTDKPMQTITAPFSDASPYPKPQSISLTTAIDNIVGTTGDDVINASQQSGSAVVSALDKIDGGAGNDLLSISDATHDAGITGLSVKNVETLTYVSTENLGSAHDSASTLDVTGWTGLKTASITLQNIGTAANTVKAAADADLTITSNSTDASGLWTIEGGKTVTLNQTSTTSAAGAAITGKEGTTSVSVTQSPAGSAAAVDVTDWANDSVKAGNSAKTGTITSVSLNGIKVSSIDAATTSTISSNALTNLSLTKLSSAGTNVVEIADNLDGHKNGNGTTLAVTLNDVTGTQIKDVNATVKELDFTTTGAKSMITLNNASQLTTVKVTGDQSLDLGDVHGLGKLATLTATGTGGVTAQVDATKVAVTTGDGGDKITLNGVLSKAVDLGAGDDWIQANLKSDHKTLDGGTIAGGDGTDTIKLTGQEAVLATTGTGLAGQISGFEVLEISGSNAGTVDLHNLDDINQVVLSGDFGAGGYKLDKLASGAKLTITHDQSSTGTIVVPVSAVQNETLTLTLKSDGDSATPSVAANTLDTGNINTVALTATDTDSGKNGPSATDSVTLVGPKNVTIAGSVATLNVNTGTAGSVDATAMSKGDLTITTTAGNGSTILGTVNGKNTVNATGAGNITVTTGDKDDTIHVHGGSTVNAGNGANVIDADSSGNTINGGKDGNRVALTNTSGTNTVTVGDGVDYVVVEGAATTNITLGGGDADTVVLNSKAGGNKSGYFVSVTGAGDKDIIGLNAGVFNGTPVNSAISQVTLGQGSSFTDYVNAATADDGVGNPHHTAGTGNSVVSWFNYNNETYIVVDNNDGAYVAGSDVVVRLTNSLNLGTTGSNHTDMTVAVGDLDPSAATVNGLIITL